MFFIFAMFTRLFRRIVRRWERVTGRRGREIRDGEEKSTATDESPGAAAASSTTTKAERGNASAEGVDSTPTQPAAAAEPSRGPSSSPCVDEEQHQLSDTSAEASSTADEASPPSETSSHTECEENPTSSEEKPQQHKESTTIDYTTHQRRPVVEETVTKHVHTVYHPVRTRSMHFHEHVYHIQPIVDASEHHDSSKAEMDKTVGMDVDVHG